MGLSEEEKRKRDGLLAEEWRQFGYLVLLDEEKKAYRFIGSPFGLKQFCWGIRDYVSNEKNNEQGEHDHWTPVGYLKIMTWPETILDGEVIAGTFDDLKRLSTIISSNLKDENIGKSFLIKEEFSKKSTWAIQLEIQPYGYDPSLGYAEAYPSAWQ